VVRWRLQEVDEIEGYGISSSCIPMLRCYAATVAVSTVAVFAKTWCRLVSTLSVLIEGAIVVNTKMHIYDMAINCL
jgi:hypothetical protein